MDIKGIILDVDGVIIGEKIGFNSPWPHPNIINKLKEIRKSGIFISLCTAKPYFSIAKIIKDANLSNLHLTDSGGVIIDLINNLIVTKRTINTASAQEILHTFLDNNVYVEFYTVNNYVVQKNQKSKITLQHRLA